MTGLVIKPQNKITNGRFRKVECPEPLEFRALPVESWGIEPQTSRVR